MVDSMLHTRSLLDDVQLYEIVQKLFNGGINMQLYFLKRQ